MWYSGKSIKSVFSSSCKNFQTFPVVTAPYMVVKPVPSRALKHCAAIIVDTMLVRWCPQRAAVGKLSFPLPYLIIMEEQAHDHQSDPKYAGEDKRGALVYGL